MHGDGNLRVKLEKSILETNGVPDSVVAAKELNGVQLSKRIFIN